MSRFSGGQQGFMSRCAPQTCTWGAGKSGGVSQEFP